MNNIVTVAEKPNCFPDFVALFNECSVCGQNHITEQCSILEKAIHISDAKVPQRAYLTTPSCLKVETMADGSTNIVALQNLCKGVQFGPFKAKKAPFLNPMAIMQFKLFKEADEVYLDTCDLDHSNWMSLVAPAANADEQNLICYQHNSEVYFSAIKDLKAGDYLKVWYSSHYAFKMGLTIFPTPKHKPTEEANYSDTELCKRIAEKLPATALGAAAEKSKWSCRMCGAVETNVAIYAKHLIEHYKRLAEHICPDCGKSFTAEKHLRKHRQTNGQCTPSQPQVTLTGEKAEEQPLLLAFSNSANNSMAKTLRKNDCLVGGLPEPHLDAVMLQSSSSSLLLDQLSIGENHLGISLDEEDDTMLGAMLCGEDVTSKGTKKEKTIADFSSLDLVGNDEAAEPLSMDMLPPSQEQEEQEEQQQICEQMSNLKAPFVCDICAKTFASVRYLCRHLRKHCGDFICLYCLAVFCRKENLRSHSCPKRPPLTTAARGDQYLQQQQLNVCPVCQKTFAQRKYFKRHLASHLKPFRCQRCTRGFSTPADMRSHNCRLVDDADKAAFDCTICQQRFYRAVNLRKHQRSVHKQLQQPNGKNQQDSVEAKVCEYCGTVCSSAKAMRAHLLHHAEPRFRCQVCDKRFRRLDVYTNHVSTHGDAQISCHICGKKVKTKKSLSVHMLQHQADDASNSKKTHGCPVCGKRFFQRGNMERHHRLTHMTLNNSNSSQPIECTACGKRFDSKRLLKAHHDARHGEDKRFACQHCECTFTKEYLLRRHALKHSARKAFTCPFCSAAFKAKASVRRHIAGVHPERKNEPETTTTATAAPSSGVFREMSAPPSFEDAEQQVTLGRNAFILDDGTIVQPEEEGKIVLYVLEQRLSNGQ